MFGTACLYFSIHLPKIRVVQTLRTILGNPLFVQVRSWMFIMIGSAAHVIDLILRWAGASKPYRFSNTASMILVIEARGHWSQRALHLYCRSSKYVHGKLQTAARIMVTSRDGPRRSEKRKATLTMAIVVALDKLAMLYYSWCYHSPYYIDPSLTLVPVFHHQIQRNLLQSLSFLFARRRLFLLLAM